MLTSTLTQVAQQGLVNAYEASHSKVVGKNLWSILCKSRTILQTCRRSKSMRLRLLLLFFLFLLVPMWVGAQEESGTPIDDDPLLSNKVNLDGNSANVNPDSRVFNTTNQLAS